MSEFSPSLRRAAIDVGTNSVKLLVGEVHSQSVTPVFEDSKQTRLGAGFYETHRLQSEPIARTAEAVARFAQVAREMGAASIRVIGTSAARDSLNASQLVEAVHHASGLAMEIISGEQEADWAFHGVTSDPRYAALPLLILDVGGGSSEFIVGEKRVQSFRHSYRMGTVRLYEQLHLPDPPGLDALAQCEASVSQFLDTVALLVEPHLRACSRTPCLIGTGGSTTILARMAGGMESFDRDRIESTVLTLDWVQNETHRLWQMPLEERRQIRGLPPKRADVILTGILIYQQIMRRFEFAELRTSTRGLRYTALLEPGLHFTPE